METEGTGKSSIMEKEGSGTSSVRAKSQKKMVKSEKSSKRMKKAKKLKVICKEEEVLICKVFKITMLVQA